jgi:hypothetical protein
LGSFEQGENLDGFHIAETNTSGDHGLRIAVTDLFGRVYEDTFELRPPDPPGDLIFLSLESERIQVSWQSSPSLDVIHYNLYRSSTSGGPYVLTNTNPVEHAVFLDTGLDPNMEFYYVATAIDESGNQSVFSDEFAAATNPPQMSGFPATLASEGASSPAVGDIDGDGDNEIVVGNHYVYAFHHDGTEVVDGDNDPSTPGILSPLGEFFVGAIALARIDGQPGLDIIAADLTTESVYCFNSNGDLLPGWPQVAENDFRASPLVCDLDGDGVWEIVAIDTKGVIYAWRTDGAEWHDGDNDPLTHGVFFRTPETTFHHTGLTACDIDGDNRDEIIVGTRANVIYALNDDGSAVSGWPFNMAGEIAGSIAAGDVDNDGFPELVAHAKTSEVYLINHDGTLAAGWPRFVTTTQPFFAPSPALADVDDDGTLEIAVAYADFNESRLYLINHDGTDYPGWPIVYSTDDYTESSPVVADINGDGAVDIVLGDESGVVRGWEVDGSTIVGFPIGTMIDAVRATPFLGDIDLDGDIDMVVQNWDKNLYIYDLSGGYDPGKTPWPTLEANVHRNGKIDFEVPTAVPDAIVTYAELQQNYPNPFNPTTRIAFTVAAGSAQHVTLVIYDVTGARVRVLVDGARGPGQHEATWDGRDAAGNPVGSGVYFYRLEQQGFSATRKMVLLK